MLSLACAGLEWFRRHAIWRIVIVLGLGLTVLVNFWAPRAASATAQGWIAVAWNDGDATNIYAIHPDGSDFHPLTTGGDNFDPVWSPDASQIAYLHLSDGHPTIYLMNADGTHSHPLDPQGTLLDMGEPTWSPDGKRIAFVGPAVSQTGEARHIYLINTDGGHLQALPYDIKTFVDGGWCGQSFWPFWPQNLQWSPDGQHLAFQDTLCQMFHNASYVMNANGSHPVQYQVSGMRLAWSPDGQRLALAGDPVPSGIVIIVATGASYQIDCTGSMSWSPNGQTIACTLYGNGLHLENVDGANFRTISQLNILSTPVWSPDSQQLAFVAALDSQLSILNVDVINADGTGLHTVLRGNNTAFVDSVVAWSPK